MASNMAAGILVVCSLLVTGVLSSTIPIGEIFETETEVSMINQPATFVFTNKVFKQGTVISFKGMFSNSSEIIFQIWRPLGENRYHLVGQKEFQPTRIPAMFEIPLAVTEYISVQDGDMLGFAKMSAVNSVVTQFDGSLSMGVIYSPEIDVFELRTGHTVTFDPTPLPLKFSVMATYIEGTDLIPDLQKGEAPTASPRQITKPTIPARPPSEGSKVYYGASITNRDSVLDQAAHATFLLPVGLLPGGQLVKFYAVFNRKESVLLQVWREMSNGIVFKLVGQVKYTPVTTGPIEIILDEADYIQTQLGDCLGFTQLESTSGIGYNFDANMDNALRPIVASREVAPSAGQVMTFTALGVPYDFALGAMVDTARALPVAEPTPEPEATTRSEDLVIPQAPDESILSQSMISNLGSIHTGASRTYLMESVEFPEDAFVTAFSTYCVNNGLVQFQIWRRVTQHEELFKLVGYKDFMVSSAPGLRTMRLASSSIIPVRKGDFIGFVNPGTVGVIGYVFHHQMSGLALYTSAADLNVNIGQQVAFDILPFPYKFAVAVNYVKRDASSEEDDSFGINQFDDLRSLQTISPTQTSNGIVVEDGEHLISQSMEPTSSAISQRAAQTYIVANLKFPEGGRVTSFSAFVVNKGQIQFQIWRQISVTSLKLIGGQNVTVTTGPGVINVRLPNALRVERGDMLGFVNADDKGIVGYKFEESTTGLPVYHSPARLNLSPNQEMAFDLIRLPYKFSLAATYLPDDSAVIKKTNTSVMTGQINSDDVQLNRFGETSGIGGSATESPGATSDPDGEPSESATKSRTISSATSGTVTGSSAPPGNLDGNASPEEEPTETTVKKTTLLDNILFPRSNDVAEVRQEIIPAPLRPLTSVYLTLIMLIWLIVITLLLIGCSAFWFYKKKKGRPYNYMSYRSSSVPSLVGSNDFGKDRDSLVRFYHSTGLLGGPGFPDNRFENPYRTESSIDDGDRTYL